MRGYFGLGQLSSEEKSDILNQHKSVYNGYQTMQPQVSNTQPLTVYDFAGDKEGMVVNNKGEVKRYTNMGINEQVETKEVCDECGSMMTEGECNECGYKSEMGEGKKFPDLNGDGEVTYADVLKGRGVKPKNSKFDKAIKKVNSISKKHGMEEEDSEWDVTLMDGLDEETGHLDDIYNVNDLNPNSGFDYIEGGSNDVDTFEGMHKNLYKEDEEEDMVDYENDDNEDDGFLDDQLDEQGGNADDMDVDDVESAYNFDSNGPMSGGDVYPVNEFETMESAWADDEIEEVDISGSQGVYGDMDPAFDFDSEGPGKGGPYQEFSYESEDDEDDMEDEEDEWIEVDDDLQEDFKNQKNKIMEMFNRFNRYN